MLKPNKLYTCYNHASIFGFGARARNYVLFLWAQRKKIGTKQDTRTWRRPSIIRTTCLIDIKICMKIKRRTEIKLKTIVHGTFEISQYSFDRIPMLFGGRMHELGSFIHRECNIRLCYGSILKSSHGASVNVRISHRWNLKFLKEIDHVKWICCKVWCHPFWCEQEDHKHI